MTPGLGKMRAGLQAEGPLYGQGCKTPIPPRFESPPPQPRPGPTVRAREDAPPDPPSPASDHPLAPPASLRTSAIPAPGRRGHPELSRAGAPAGAAGWPAGGPAGGAAGAGAGPAFSCKTAAGAGRAPGGGACRRPAALPPRLLRVFSARDARRRAAAARPGEAGAGGRSRRRLQPAGHRAPAPPASLTRHLGVRGRAQSLPRPGVAARREPGARRPSRYCWPTLLVSPAAPTSAEAGGAERSARAGRAGMGGGRSGDGEPGSAARTGQRRR